jgi:hypothetical protein
MRYSIVVVLISIASLAVVSDAFGQSVASVAKDSSAAILHTNRALPPSMAAELRRAQKNRALVYHDTLHASDLEREHFNDSVSREYADSAISVVDTAVSLPHKEWLDSELVEIPELARLGSHVHYNYPPSLMMETELRSTSFDSTLVERMNPVTRENLPYFDQSPLPIPLEPPARSESYLEAGGGNVALPRAAGWLAQPLSERSSMNLSGEYRSLQASRSAVHNFGDLSATLESQLGEDPALDAYHSQDLKVQAGYDVKSIAIDNLSKNDRALAQFSGLASIDGDVTRSFHYNARFEDHELSDGLSGGASESSQDVALGTRFDVSNYRVIAEGNYSLASLSCDTNVTTGANFFGRMSTPIHAESAKALFGDPNDGNLSWYVGAEYLGGAGVDGSSYSAVLPALRGQMQINALTSIGASFEPQVQLASFRALTLVDPFYSPELVSQSKQNGLSIAAPVDGRSVVMDKINLAAFFNYMLSSDDELRVEARYITRDREPIFNIASAKDSANLFTVTPESTQHFDFTAAGSIRVFSRDEITGTAEFISVDRSIPFEPTATASLDYHFNSIWGAVEPSVSIQMISRPGETFTFLDANVDAQLSQAVVITVRLENILGGASDFWPGYPEKPQSIWATVRYRF